MHSDTFSRHRLAGSVPVIESPYFQTDEQLLQTAAGAGHQPPSDSATE